MARTSSRETQSKTQPNMAPDDDLAALIEQCSKDVRCGLSRAHYLCRLMPAPFRFGALEQIDRLKADWLMVSVKPLIEHYRAAAKTIPIVSQLVNAVADRTCAHVEAFRFAFEVQMAFVCEHTVSERPEMADSIVSQWQSIRDFLLRVQIPDLGELDNRIGVESAKAIESVRCRTNRQPEDSVHIATNTVETGHRSNPRGRPRKHDPSEQEILDAWGTGNHPTYVECAESLSLGKWNNRVGWRRVKRVVENHNKRLKRPRKSK